MFQKFACVAAAALTLGAAAPAAAVELIQNGGFESVTDFQHADNWTTTGNWQFYGSGNQHSGAKSAAVQGCFTLESAANCTLSQTVATTAGQTYELTFWANGYSTTGFWGIFDVVFDGVDYGAIYVTPGNVKYKYQVTATSDSTVLEIRSANNFSFNYIDDISLQPFAVPEPSTWALMIAGFGLAGSALRRRTRAVA